MLLLDKRTTSASGAFGRQERHESAGMRLVTAASQCRSIVRRSIAGWGGGSVQPDRTRLYLRIPFHIPNPMLRPGPIEIKILHEEGETFAGRQWIFTVEQAQAMRSPVQVKSN